VPRPLLIKAVLSLWRRPASFRRNAAALSPKPVRSARAASVTIVSQLALERDALAGRAGLQATNRLVIDIPDHDLRHDILQLK